MKITQLRNRISLSLLVLAGTLSVSNLSGQVQGRIEVRGVMGSANFTVGGGTVGALQAGMALPMGAVITTGLSSAVDLALSHDAGIIRLVQNSSLYLDKFTAADLSPGAAVDLQLYLIEGTMLGVENRLPSSSKYQIKVTRGIADVSGAKYRLNAQGYLVVLQGAGLFVFVPPAGEPVPFQLRAPPPAYFSPVEGIKPAPDELVREVVLQTKGKLRR